MYNLCCISNELKNDGYSFKTMTWKQFTDICNKDGEDAALRILGSRWLNNINVTGRIMRHCGLNNWGYRVSSDLFPCLTHPDFSYDIEQVPQYKSIMNEFSGIAACNAHPCLNKQTIRLSCHPDQFNVLASDNAVSVDKTIKELNHHGWVMDMLGCERSHYNPINIHINCSKGDPKEIAERFVDNLFKCNDSVVSRLVVENEDKGLWTVTNLLKYIYQIPITFDNLHHKCNPCGLTEDAAMKFCAFTWGDTKPLFHYSESEPNHKNIRAHADMPLDIPPSELYDWDIELKGKDTAIRQLYLIELTRESETLGLYDT